MTIPVAVSGLKAGVARRFGFRFIATYLLLYNAARLWSLIPFLGPYSYRARSFSTQATLWTEKNVLRMTQLSPTAISGSGDTSLLWMEAACMLGLAMLVALGWAFFDRSRRRDRVISEGLRVAVRYSLAVVLIDYGLSKLVPPTQFPAPWAVKLIEPVGQLSPMGLLWTFMGASPAYTAFAGIMELMAGLLLLFRRTTPLGAVVSAGVVLNIVLLNFCYDVPVKLFSLNLLLMAGFILWPDVPRLLCVLVMNRPAPAAVLAPFWKATRYGVLLVVLKVAVLGTLAYRQGQRIYQSGPEYKDPPASILQLTGIWEVETFTADGVTLPRSLNPEPRWNLVVLDRAWGGLRLYVFGVDNHMQAGWWVAPTSTEKRLVLLPSKSQTPPVILKSERPQPDVIVLSGNIWGHELKVQIRRANENRTQLQNRGFHWVTEYPFNR